MKNLYQRQGFTLIELLVVIAIIGILSAVVLTSLDSARAQARDSKRYSDIAQIQKALELYHIDNGAYPISSWVCSYNSNWSTTSTLGSALEPYLPSVPIDPVNENTNLSAYGYLSYCYYAQNYGGSGDWYSLVFTVEEQNIDYDGTHYSLACDDTKFQYGGTSDGYIMTVGGSCVQ